MAFIDTERKQMHRSDQASFDIENPYSLLANTMEKKLESLSPLSSECSIYRVPEYVRHVNENAYTPQVVSIGPLHHGRTSLKAMEDHKLRYLKDFIEQTNESVEFYIKIVKENEERLRRCYAETLHFSSDEFVEVILLDAAFVIEILLKFCFEEMRDENDQIFSRPSMFWEVSLDMILLENQLPFFILQNLFDPDKITIPLEHDERLSIIKMSCYFIKAAMEIGGAEDILAKIYSCEVEHFVALLRHLHLPSRKQDTGTIKTLTMPTVTELHQAGVKFKVGSKRNLFDVQFKEGILEIPKLIIGKQTEVLIRNMVAFEQCNCLENYMNDYVIIMDCFVDTHEDVDLLVKYGIVENWRGDKNEAATLINKLADGASFNPQNFYFSGLSEDLNTYCRTSWHKWKANLKQKYFNTPWAVISFIAGIFLLVLTFTQTVCSVISV